MNHLGAAVIIAGAAGAFLLYRRSSGRAIVASPSGDNIAPEGMTGSALMQWNMERLGYEWTKAGRDAYRHRPKDEGGW